jgi:hypothetical protein
MRRIILPTLVLAFLGFVAFVTPTRGQDAPDTNIQKQPVESEQRSGALLPIADPGKALNALISGCRINSLIFDFLDGSGSTGPDLATYPPRAVFGDSVVFEKNTVGAVGGRPYLFGTLTLTLLGEDRETGEWVVTGSIVGPQSTVTMEPLRIDPAAATDLYESIVEADNDGEDVWERLTTAPAAFTGTVNGEPFAYKLRWHLGFNSLNHAGCPDCDE